MSQISKEGLQKLASYKYKAGEYSIMDHVLTPYWNFCVSILPLWLAPNLITVLGLFVYSTVTLIQLSYALNLQGQVPGWTFYLIGFGLFFYQTTDAIDGKQARRTNSSSPLGQLIDHGCDCFVVSLQSINLIINFHLIFGLLYKQNRFFHKQSNIIFLMYILRLYKYKIENIFDVRTILLQLFQKFLFQSMMFIAQQNESHTHIMKTNMGAIGVTEGALIMITLFCFTGYYGQSIWSTPLELDLYFYQMKTYKDAFHLVNLGILCQIFGLVVDSLKHSKNRLGFFPEWLPMIHSLVTQYIITKSGIFDDYLGISILIFGMNFSVICQKMIISSLTETKFELFHFELVLQTLLAVVLLIFQDTIPLSILRIIYVINLVSIVFNCFKYAESIINQITKHLNIKCFTIPYKLNKQ